MEATMQRAVLVFTCIVLILVWGGVSAYHMQRDYLPSINNSALTITVRAPEQDAEQIQSTIGREIEQAVRSIDGLQNMENDAFDGGLLTRLYFPLHADMAEAEKAIHQAVATIALPADVQKPIVSRVSTSSFPIVRLSLMSNGKAVSDTALRTTVQAKVAQELQSVPGVSEVRVTGAGNNGYVVTVRLPDLKKAGVSLASVKQAMASLNLSWPQGNIATDQHAIPVRVEGWEKNLQELKELPVPSSGGQTVPLASISDVTATTVNLQTISRTDGEASVLFDVLKMPSANITDVSARVKERMQYIPGLNMQDVQLAVQADQGAQVQSALNSLFREGLLGCVFAMACVLLFFRNVRSTLLIALSLPICLLATTGILKALGISLNILTVSGLIVAMGRVVDDSIVILDNMYRRVQQEDGKPTMALLADAVREMMPAIVSSTATTIAVYLPIAMVGGMISAAFSGFAWSVVIALVISLLVSVLVVPALAHLWWRGQRLQASETAEPFAKRVLLYAMTHRKKVTGAALALFVITCVLAAFFPVNFLPSNNNTTVAVHVELPEGTTLPEVDAEVQRIEAQLKRNADIVTFSTGLGSSLTPQNDDVFDQGGGWIQSPTVANIALTTKAGVDLEAFIQDLRNQLHDVSRVAVCSVASQNIAGDDSKLKIELSGSDQQTLQTTAQIIQSKLQLVPGIAVDGAADQEGVAPKYHLVLNHDKIKQAGVNPADVYRAIDQYLAHSQQANAPIQLQVKTAAIANGGDPAKEVLLAMAGEMIHTPDGKSMPLDQLASVVPKTGLAHVDQKDGKPFAYVTGNIIAPDLAKVTGQVKDVIAGLSLPAGVQVSFGGIPEQVKEMVYEMSIAISISILLVLLIVSAVFRGWKAPLSVLVCIPLAFIGSVWGLFLFGKGWDLAACVGLLMLTGIVVTNGIVLVDKIERNLRAGMARRQAVLQGTLSRVRPVLMTACTTILTLLPLMLAAGSDSIISQTLGIVVVGGMISSTLISLLVIPITYERMTRKTMSSQSLSDSYTNKLFMSDNL
jgi:multidrug efflux pump subunit AcrB